jgi:triacylglycerol lipase
MRYVRLGSLAVALTVVSGSAACTGAAAAPSGRTPVIFVHGYLEGPANWSVAIARFRTAGYGDAELDAVRYDYVVSVTESAKTLAHEVDAVRARTGAAKVDIVSHSLGSLVTKQCIIADACAGKVAHWMSISGADNGTTVELGDTPSGDDVHGRSPVRAYLDAHWSDLVAQGVRVEVQWTPFDEIIRPPRNSEEPAPAVNKRVFALDHLTIILTPAVIDEAVRFLAS